jgi:hypothetical protein
MARPSTLASFAALGVATAACASVDTAQIAGDAAGPGVAQGAEQRLPTLATAPDPGDRPAARVLGKLRLKDVDLTLASTGAGARFAVTPRGEAPSAVPLTEESLAKQHPELYELYRSSVARHVPYVDARLDQTSSERAEPWY